VAGGVPKHALAGPDVTVRLGKKRYSYREFGTGHRQRTRTMKQPSTRISFFGQQDGRLKGLRTAVSLHAHSRHSKEDLDFVNRYAGRIPVISRLYQREQNRYRRLQGKALDFAQAYWTPPLPARVVYESEREHIHDSLGLDALVSLTDHDELAWLPPLTNTHASQAIPLSVEWTVPIGMSFVHLGVHNLPLHESEQILNELVSYTVHPKEATFGELLAWLNEDRGTLVVLNHPLSDLKPLGPEALRRFVGGFLGHYSNGIHALEINGYRTWRENRAAMTLADRHGLPLVSGGDRHGRAPNAVLNLTTANSFTEFVAEVRGDKTSHILIMPEYRNKRVFTRKMDSVADFFCDYPENPRGQQRWTDRVFFQLEDGLVRPLSYYWQRTVPTWVKSVMWVIQLIRLRNGVQTRSR
jgi:hypothetical protein